MTIEKGDTTGNGSELTQYSASGGESHLSLSDLPI